MVICIEFIYIYISLSLSVHRHEFIRFTRVAETIWGIQRMNSIGDLQWQLLGWEGILVEAGWCHLTPWHFMDLLVQTESPS